MKLMPDSLFGSSVRGDFLEDRDVAERAPPDTVTQTVSVTVGQNFTIHITTKLYYTITEISLVSMTFNHTTTATQMRTVSFPVTTTRMRTVSFPVTTTQMSTVPLTLTLSSPSSSVITPTPSLTTAPSSTTPPPTAATSSAAAVDAHKIHPALIVGIGLGVVAFLGLVFGAFLLTRRFYKMYRKQRVWRKQVQAEGNELPMVQATRGGGIEIVPAAHLSTPPSYTAREII